MITCAQCGPYPRIGAVARYPRGPWGVTPQIDLICKQCGNIVQWIAEDYLIRGDPETGVIVAHDAPLPLSARGWLTLKYVGRFSWGMTTPTAWATAHSILAHVFDPETADAYWHQYFWSVVLGWDVRLPIQIRASEVIRWLNEWQADVDWVEQTQPKR